MRGPIRWLARPRKRLLVSLEWVDVRRMRCLVLAARLRGRALPLLWAVYRHQELFRSQNNLEYGLLRLLLVLLVLALAYWLLAAVGLHAAKHFSAKLWCSNNKPCSCSLFTIGRTLLDRLKLDLPRAMNQLR